MPRMPEMTWVPDRKRWMKKHKGKMYAVSCRELPGLPPELWTKEGSYVKANEWWERKQKEIDAPEAARVARMTESITELLSVGAATATLQAKRNALAKLLELPDVPESVFDVVTDFSLPPAAPAKAKLTAKDQVAHFLAGLQARSEAGQMDLTRYDAYRRELDRFLDWFGPDRSVTEINEEAVDRLYLHLLGQVKARREWQAVPLKSGERKPGMKPSYAKQIFSTFKLFTYDLAGRKVIPCPANLGLTKFKFRKGKKVPGSWTIEEVRQALACGDYGEKTTCFLLLMLNCGMYQNDIAELRQDQVDWDKGTITRIRSKNEERDEDGDKILTVTYKLWGRTLELMEKYREPAGKLVFRTEKGGAYVVQSRKADGKMSRTDNVKSAYVRLCNRLGLPKKPLMFLRKTASNLIKQGPHKDYADYYLAHTPKSLGEDRYYSLSEKDFFKALTWLHDQIFAKATK